MFDGLHAAMRRHALDEHPRAVCGGVFGDRDDPVFLPIEEIASNSRSGFHLEHGVLQRMEAAAGSLLAIMYSHPSEREDDVDPVLFTPSAAEMRWQLSAAVPFLVLVTTPARVVDLYWFGDQCPIPPLVGRIFRHGVTDCYSLIRDWCRLERDLTIAEFPRDWNWWTSGRGGPDLYEEGFGQAGFREIEPQAAVEGDVVLFRIRSKVTNHGGVVLRDGRLIHHPGYLSPIDSARMSHITRLDRWAGHATHWVRHQSLDGR